MKISYSDLLRPLSKSETSVLFKGQLGKIYKRAPRYYKAGAVQSYLRLEDPGYLAVTSEDLRTDSCFKGKDDGFYNGQLDQKNRRHGLGLLVQTDGSIYHGFFKNGIMRGQGRKFTPKGDIYFGEWKNESIKGIGSIIYVQKQHEYIGELINNVPNGKGTLVSENNILYVGEFKNGHKHGKGKCLWPDGSSYDGEFQYSQLQGTGKFIFENGDEFNGQWKNNVMEGNGRYRWADGSWYHGGYHNGLKEGFGELYSTKIYCGYLEKGKCDGVGVEINENGEIYEGVWKKGNLVIFDPSIAQELTEEFKRNQIKIRENPAEFLCDFSEIEISESMQKLTKQFCFGISAQSNNRVQAKWIKVSDFYYKGQVNFEGLPDGIGVSLTSDTCYQGFFNNAQRSGFGREIFSDGSVYQGYWSNDLKHGFGVLSHQGVSYIGDWVCGNFVHPNVDKSVALDDTFKDTSISPDICYKCSSLEDFEISAVAEESVLQFYTEYNQMDQQN